MNKKVNNYLGKDYVFIDIETNSHGNKPNPLEDEIIDIGALKVYSSNKFEEFTTKVKINGKLTGYAKFLTKISENDIKNGKPVEEAVKELEKFVGELPIVGHNIKNFDVRALAKHSDIIDKRILYDTIELAFFLDPANKKGHSVQKYLEDIKEKNYKEKHRGLPDCWDEQALLKYLLTTVLEKNWSDKLAWLRSVSNMAQEDGFSWGEIILQKLAGRMISDKEFDLVPVKYLPRVKKNGDKNNESIQHVKISEDEIDKIFSGKDFKRGFYGNFEERIEQVDLAKKIARGISEKHHVLAEAGTGVGKTLAYLIPSVLYTIKTGGEAKTVIATKTKLLQDQIMDDDLPKVFQLFSENVIKVASIKGRQNYVCLLKCAEYLESEFSGNKLSNKYEEDYFTNTLSKILLINWILMSEQGDLETFPYPIEKKILNGDKLKIMIRDTKRHCINKLCPYYDHCFIRRNRQKAREANIIVTNYNLVLSDILQIYENTYHSSDKGKEMETLSENPEENNNTDTEKISESISGNILPDFNALILDEAHHLENIATEALTQRFSKKILTDIYYEMSSYERPGSLPRRLRKFNKIPHVKEIIEVMVSNQSLKIAIDLLFKALHENVYIRNNIQREINETRDVGYPVQFELNKNDVPDSAWRDIQKRCSNVEVVLRELRNSIFKINNNINHDDFDSGKDFQIFGKLMKSLQNQFEFIRSSMSVLSTLDIDRRNFIIEVKAERYEEKKYSGVDIFLSIKDYEFSVIPLDIGNELFENIWNKISHSTLISATLANMNRDFGLISRTTGLHKSDRVLNICKNSPFPYSDHALLLQINDLPDVKNGNFHKKAVECLKKLLIANQGRALVLCTSKRDVENIYRDILDECEAHGILARTQSGKLSSVSNRKLVAEMRENSNMVLIGTNSLHEGIDVPGPNLDLIVIWKLPYERPTPFIKSKNIIHYGYYDDKSISRFRQQCGRLIRNHTDKGHIVVLDTRFRKKEKFVFSLPSELLRYRITQQHAANLLENWAKNREKKGYTPRRNLYEVFPGNAENERVESVG